MLGKRKGIGERRQKETTKKGKEEPARRGERKYRKRGEVRAYWGGLGRGGRSAGREGRKGQQRGTERGDRSVRGDKVKIRGGIVHWEGKGECTED